MSGRGRGGGGRGAYYKARYGNGGRGARGGGSQGANYAVSDQTSSSHRNDGQSGWDQLESTLVSIDGAQYGKLLPTSFTVPRSVLLLVQSFSHQVATGIDVSIQVRTRDCWASTAMPLHDLS